MAYNLIVLGVGHSGTRFLVQLCSHLGWNTGKVDIHWELPEIVRINVNFLSAYRTNNEAVFECTAARNLIDSLDPPWIIKDPRFIYTLPQWLDILDTPPILVHIERDPDEILKSHQRRHENVAGKEGILRGQKRARELYNSYGGPKWSVTYEQIVAAIKTYRER